MKWPYKAMPFTNIVFYKLLITVLIRKMVKYNFPYNSLPLCYPNYSCQTVFFFQVSECAKLEDSLIDTKGKLEMSELRIQQVPNVTLSRKQIVLINFGFKCEEYFFLFFGTFAVIWWREYIRQFCANRSVSYGKI